MSLQNYKSGNTKKKAISKKWKILAAVFILFVLGWFAFMHFLKVPPASVRDVAVFSSTLERDQMAYSLDQRVRSLAYTAQVRRDQKTELVVGEKEFNAYIQASPDIQRKLQSAGASDPVVKLDKDQVIISAYVPVKGNKLPVTATANVSQGAGGSMTVDIIDLKVGMFSVPSSMAEKIEAELMNLENGKIDLPPGVTGVSVEDGKLIVNVDSHFQLPR